jgi:hypothetical protein
MISTPHLQALWFISSVTAAIGIKLRWPHLLIPYILLTTVAIFAVLFLLAVGILRLSRGAQPSWPLLLTMGLSTVFILVEGYLIVIKYLCLRYLIRKRKAVVATSDKGGKVRRCLWINWNDAKKLSIIMLAINIF